MDDRAFPEVVRLYRRALSGATTENPGNRIRGLLENRSTPLDVRDLHRALLPRGGCEGLRVTRADESGPALDRAMASPVPCVVDVLAAPGAVPPITGMRGDVS